MQQGRQPSSTVEDLHPIPTEATGKSFLEITPTIEYQYLDKSCQGSPLLPTRTGELSLQPLIALDAIRFNTDGTSRQLLKSSTIGSPYSAD